MAIPFPFLITEGLHLRKILPADLARIHYFRSDKNINKYIIRPHPQTLEMTREHILNISAEMRTNKSITWAITIKNSKLMIGTICLWNFSEDRKTAEVGYALDPDFHGKGIMTEALKAVVHFGFNQGGLTMLKAYTDCRNNPSKKLLINFGFIPSSTENDVDNQNNMVYNLKL